jgi:hypothetical protein
MKQIAHYQTLTGFFKRDENDLFSQFLAILAGLRVSGLVVHRRRFDEWFGRIERIPRPEKG